MYYYVLLKSSLTVEVQFLGNSSLIVYVSNVALSIYLELQLHSFLMSLNFQMQYLLFKSKLNYLNLMLNY